MANTELPASDSDGNLNLFLQRLNETGLCGERRYLNHPGIGAPSRRLSEAAKAFRIPLSDYCTRELFLQNIRSLDYLGRSANGSDVFLLALSMKTTTALEMFDPLLDEDLENDCSEDQPAGVGEYLQNDGVLESDYESNDEDLEE